MGQTRLRNARYDRRCCMYLLIIWIVGSCCSLLIGCQNSGEIHPRDAQVTVQEWPLADRLFHADPRWLGADGAHSIDLEDGRLLWLFGDSFINTKGTSHRRDAFLVRNSVALQFGYDPLNARIQFIWGGTPELPNAYFKRSDPSWFWPGHGVRLDDHVLLFLLEIRSAKNPLGFTVAGTQIAKLSGIDGESAQWHVVWLDTPTDWFSRPWATAYLLKLERYVYAFLVDAASDHNVHLARWPLDAARRGDLAQPQWWAGKEQGWRLASEQPNPPKALFDRGQTEFTVHYDPLGQHFFLFQTLGFGAAQIAYRRAAHITGPWSAPTAIYRPPEYDIERVLIYGAQAHPALQGTELVLTYNSNHLDTEVLFSRTDLYYPRFLKGRFLLQR